MSNEQTVIDTTDTEAAPSGEVSNALDDLDSDLAEFDKAKPAQQEPQPGLDDATLVTQYVKSQMEKDAKAETQTDIGGAVSLIKDGLEVNAPDIAVKGMLYAEVEEDPAALGAWQARKTNPNGWNQVLKRVRNRIKEEFKPQPDQDLTDDRDAVSAAVHSASKHTSQEVEKDWSKMSDHEFEMEKAKIK